MRGDINDIAGVTRRRLLALTAAGAVGLGASTGVASAGEPDPDVDVMPLGGGDRRAAIASVQRDDRGNRLHRWLVKQGYQPVPNDAKAVETEYEGETWRTVTIPYRDGDSSQEKQTYLAWSNNPELDRQVTAVHVTHHEDYWAWERATIEDGEVVVETGETENFLGCSSVNWGCVLTLAGAYGGTIAACGTCAASSGWLVWACAACISAILGSAGATLTCDWCND